MPELDAPRRTNPIGPLRTQASPSGQALIDMVRHDGGLALTLLRSISELQQPPWTHSNCPKTRQIELRPRTVQHNVSLS